MSKSSKKDTSKYPYYIHCCILTGDPPFPTHTHGLYANDLPEFIFDPLAFGGGGNGNRINAAYDYFMKPKNRSLLDDVLNGKIIKLTGNKLLGKKAKDIYTYCFREVPASFAAVKEAYGSSIDSVCPGIRFVQIWVDGDDFALKDSYYAGGVKF